MTKKVTVIGATGLIGGHLVALLQNDPEIETITLISRREIDPKASKATVVVIDFEDQQALQKAINGSDVVFCAVGTTQKKVKGDKEAYRKVDFDIPLHAAQCCKAVGCPQFLVVSSVGADPTSNNFYLQLKGEMEQAITVLDLPSFSVFRPSMLLGDREEFRFGEKVGKLLMKAFKVFTPVKYKPIKAKDVARAMIATSKKEGRGHKILENKEIWSSIDV